jgi:hypothetical protein
MKISLLLLSVLISLSNARLFSQTMGEPDFTIPTVSYISLIVNPHSCVDKKIRTYAYLHADGEAYYLHFDDADFVYDPPNSVFLTIAAEFTDKNLGHDEMAIRTELQNSLQNRIMVEGYFRSLSQNRTSLLIELTRWVDFHKIPDFLSEIKNEHSQKKDIE